MRRRRLSSPQRLAAEMVTTFPGGAPAPRIMARASSKSATCSPSSLVNKSTLFRAKKCRFLTNTEFAGRRIDGFGVFEGVLVRDIDDMKQQVGFFELLECRSERRDQLRRQFLDESYGVREEDDLARGSPRRRVTGSRVAKSLSSARTSAPESARMSVDFPALV